MSAEVAFDLDVESYMCLLKMKNHPAIPFNTKYLIIETRSHATWPMIEENININIHTCTHIS